MSPLFRRDAIPVLHCPQAKRFRSLRPQPPAPFLVLSVPPVQNRRRPESQPSSPQVFCPCGYLLAPKLFTLSWETQGVRRLDRSGRRVRVLGKSTALQTCPALSGGTYIGNKGAANLNYEKSYVLERTND